MAKYKKKPVVIEAHQLHHDIKSQEAICMWCNGIKGPDGGVFIHTLEGRMYAATGDYVIKGVNGEFYPVKEEIFLKTYEPCDT